VVRNIYELVDELKILNDFYFRYHSNDTRDDFGAWIGGVLEDVELSEKLRGVKNKDKYIHIIEHRIRHLERVRKLQVVKHLFMGSVVEWSKKYSILSKITVLLILLLVGIIVYVQYTSVDKLNTMSNKLSYLEQKSACYNTYLDQKITETQSYVNTTFREPLLECQKDYSLLINNPDLENIPERISVKDMTVLSNEVILRLQNPIWAVFANTSSMIPVINHNTKAIQIKPKDIQEINVGDIIAYSSGNDIIIHRVISKERDDTGYYLITKGDNNNVVDPTKIRFEQVQGIVVALIY
jgi:signal peptidase I